MGTKTILTALLISAISFAATARIITVNNRSDLPMNPGQFTNIPSAIFVAKSGDTILVAGSNTPYSSAININKDLVILGPGYNPTKQNALVATITGGIYINSMFATGTKIMGFKIASLVQLVKGAFYANITLRRNFFDSVNCEIDDSTSSLTICENVFSGCSIYFVTPKSQPNGQIINNIFENANILSCNNSTNASPIVIAHNLFIAGNDSNKLISNNWAYAFSDKTCPFGNYNYIINNNIFYNVNDTLDFHPKGISNNFTYDNNITYAGDTLPTLPAWGCVGTSNINNTNPQMDSIFNTFRTVDFNFDNLRLKKTSPALNAATNGSNIGPTGGTYPIYQSTNLYLTGEPPIPEVKYMNFVGPSATYPGGSLTIQVHAVIIN